MKHFNSATLDTAILGVLLICSINIGNAQRVGALPSSDFHYKLDVGKILYYTSRANLEYTRGTMDSQENLEIWVLGQNPDKSWHLMLRNTRNATRREGKGKPEELPTQSDLAFCDFSPSGKYTRNWALDNLALFDLFLPNLFPPLPDEFSDSLIAWEFNDRLYGESMRYSAHKPDTSERSWIVKVIDMTPLDEVYSITQRAEVYIDIVKGLPIYKKEESTRGYGYYAGKSNATTILDSIIDINSSWAERYVRELETFLTADSAYNHILDEAEQNPSQIALSRSSAEYLLSQARARSTFPDIRTQLDKLIKMLPEDFEQVTERTKKRARLVNKTAPGWEVEDFSGNKHSLGEYLGKVVLLDFWYRGCPWCIRSMPMIDQVADHFQNKPVVVLGVNTDKERSDGILVIEKMKPGYNNLFGRDLVKKYGVTNYPTFIIIDQNGLVNSIHIGYEPELDEKLINVITDLL